MNEPEKSPVALGRFRKHIFQNLEYLTYDDLRRLKNSSVVGGTLVFHAAAEQRLCAHHNEMCFSLGVGSIIAFSRHTRDLGALGVQIA